ncbi:MAG TPA: pyridoxal-phosphate dependent enzyme [Solirubrobacteraceae bacterium]|nr:pyridoxal-phosphate dependent enzyme [Solirubrobacteraceae bacterium]
MTAADAVLELEDVRRASARLDGVAHRTPVLTSHAVDSQVGAQLWFKCETFQRGGAFKFRGAYNAVASLDPEARARGVCAASSGNHAQAVTLAAGLCGTHAVILMPSDAPALKRAATEGYGAEVVEFDRYRDDREALMRALAAERGLTLVHPYDDPAVMAGQGTVALELLSQAPEGLDAVVVPVGGGGLISGCATVVTALAPGTRVIGVEPAASDDVARSLASGQRERVEVGRTIADGQQTAAPGELTWPVIRERVDQVVTVGDDEIVAAMRLLFERMKLVVEPSGACGLAALLAGAVPVAGQRVGVVLSGGNVGADAFAALMRS